MNQGYHIETYPKGRRGCEDAWSSAW